MEVQLSPRGAQRRANGAKREPKGAPAGATFLYFFVIFAGFVVNLFFNGFGTCFGVFWVVILDTFSDIAEKA